MKSEEFITVNKAAVTDYDKRRDFSLYDFYETRTRQRHIGVVVVVSFLVVESGS